MVYSVYSVAKVFCEIKDWSLSNLELNKLCYLAHMVKLGKTDCKEGLVKNVFEAWDYGPVAPALYHKAKAFGSGPVRNVFHQYESVPQGDDRDIISRILADLGDMTPGQLVAITHME